jgi:metal-dependent amidase/aminoacylase/carboxypeptidase family protein
MQIPHLINLLHSEMTVWRQDLHAHPELGFEEYRTSEFVAGKLAEFGCEVHADVAADLVGEAHVDRNRSLITAAEDFAYMLEACPGAFINIGNAGSVGSCPVHNPRYDFNDEALPIGASLFARLVEKKLPRLSDQAGPLYL